MKICKDQLQGKLACQETSYGLRSGMDGRVLNMVHAAVKSFDGEDRRHGERIKWYLFKKTIIFLGYTHIFHLLPRCFELFGTTSGMSIFWDKCPNKFLTFFYLNFLYFVVPIMCFLCSTSENPLTTFLAFQIQCNT